MANPLDELIIHEKPKHTSRMPIRRKPKPMPIEHALRLSPTLYNVLMRLVNESPDPRSIKSKQLTALLHRKLVDIVPVPTGRVIILNDLGKRALLKHILKKEGKRALDAFINGLRDE